MGIRLIKSKIWISKYMCIILTHS